MAQLIKAPSIIQAAGKKKKNIEEYFGHVSSHTSELSIAHMKSPEGWIEPGQCPEFNEYTVVLKGKLIISTRDEDHVVSAGQGIMTNINEWVRYSTPFKGGAEYIAVCMPAFSPSVVNRDQDSDKNEEN